MGSSCYCFSLIFWLTVLPISHLTSFFKEDGGYFLLIKPCVLFFFFFCCCWISTLILTVDLGCRRCYKKIRSVIAQFPEIQSQNFDEKNNKVYVSGHFDPEKLSRKLCCKACKYIKDIQIKPPDKPKPPEPTTKPATPSKPADPPKTATPEPKPDPKPAPPPPEPVLPVPGIPVGPYAPMVCCRPCYEGYPEHGICTRFGYGRGTCTYKFFSEEDPSCSIM